MADSLRKLAARLRRVERLATQANTQPQLAESAIMEGAMESWANGNIRAILGRQYDGTQALALVNGPVPPTPTVPTAVPALEGIKVYWDGLFADDLVSPMDFARVEIHASSDPDFSAELATTLVGSYETPRGGEFFVSLPPNVEYTTKLVTRSLSGGRSPASVASDPVTPDALVDAVPFRVGNPGMAQFQNGFTVGVYPCRYYTNAFNEVKMQGAVIPGDKNLAAFTLPVGMRPTFATPPTPCISGDDNAVETWMTVMVTGEVRFNWRGSTAPSQIYFNPPGFTRA